MGPLLNLGLAYCDRHEFENATAALKTVVSLGPERAETHFNLAVVYERENRLQTGRSDELGKSLIIVKEIQISVLRNPTPVLKSDPELSSNFIGSSLSATFQP